MKPRDELKKMKKINFGKKNIETINEVEAFLRERHFGASLWNWAINVSTVQRISELFYEHKEIKDCLEEDKEFIAEGAVLDLGCGFCSYWPVLRNLGYTKFVGYDLYSMRNQGDQKYMETARDLVDKFCGDCTYIIVEDDVRFIENFDQRNLKYYTSKNFKSKSASFDLIYTKNTDYKKLGSTGIPIDIFQSISRSFLKKEGIEIYKG